MEVMWTSEWGGKVIYSHGTSSARGIAVFVKKEIYQQITDIYTDNDGRVIMFNVSKNDYKITIVALYAPNEDKPDFFRQIADRLELRHEHKIIIGDFNLVLDNELDRLNTYHNNNSARDELENMIQQYCLKDVWRIRNEGKKEYSWIKRHFSRNEELKASRIDFALVSAGLDQKAEAITYLANIKSDHRAMYIYFELQASERGTGYWKFNNSLLHDKEFILEMNQEISKTLQSVNTKSYREQFEILKTRIKKKAIDYSRKKSSEEQTIIANLSEKIVEYESNLPLTEEQDRILTNSKDELEEKLFERVKGLIFRSKTRWYEGGEKNTKYFYALEKANYNAKTCYKLIGEDGQEITHSKTILQVQRQFYKELYSKDEDVKFELENSEGIYVPEEIRISQEQQITLNELEYAIKKMNNNKTPGQDGIPVDFYKVFWNQVKNCFYGMVMEVYQQSYLHDTARKGILNLIPKPNKDTRLIKNLRPITLLNVDYKIIEKAIVAISNPHSKNKPSTVNFPIQINGLSNQSMPVLSEYG